MIRCIGLQVSKLVFECQCILRRIMIQGKMYKQINKRNITNLVASVLKSDKKKRVNAQVFRKGVVMYNKTFFNNR